MEMIDQNAPTVELDALEGCGTTKRMVNNVRKNPYKWLLGTAATVLGTLIVYFGGELWAARDSTLVQKGVDEVQNIRIQHIETTVNDIKAGQKVMHAKIDKLLTR